MQTPLLSSGLLDLPVKDLRFSEPNRPSETLMVSLVIKHMLFQSFGAGSMTPATSPFTLLNYQGSGASSSSIIPFPYVTSGYVHPRLQTRLRVVWDQPTFLPAIHYQSPCVPFAIPWFRLWPTLKLLKSKHFLVPAILCDHQSRDLGWSLSINGSNLLPFLPSLWIMLS
jgi:hypothetical protein